MDNTPLRKFVPKFLKRPVKKALLRRELRSAIKKIRQLPAGQVPGRQLLSELITGWGNEGYSANLDYVEEVAKRSIETDGPILECGSGVTTILLGILCSPRQVDVWSLENSPEWGALVAGVLAQNGLSGVRVCSSPLIEYDEFVWYDPPLAEMPGEFSLVICDGPPGSTRGGRYGLLPVMGPRLPPGSTILLDDAHRDAEVEMIQRWQIEAEVDTEPGSAQNDTFAVLRRGRKNSVVAQ